MARAVVKGIPIAPGIAIGPLLLLPDSHIYEKRPIQDDEIGGEISALNLASQKVCQDLQKTVDSVPAHLSEYREIIASQIELARDPKILQGTRARIRHKKICAAWALSETIAELSAIFQDMADPYLCARAQDIKTVGQSLTDAITGFSASLKNGEPGILASYDLSPAAVIEFRLNGIDGILTVEGGITSHTAILARGLKVPAIAGVTGLFKEARPGELVIIDGIAGIALLGPDEADLAHYRARQKNYLQFEMESFQYASLPALTRDGVQIKVGANLDNIQEISQYSDCGALGIGLYRTEFSYLKGVFPTEDELFDEYKSIIEAANPQPVVIRTLDAGADKILPVQEALHEPNPALGLRGIRLCLKKKELFSTQLRAILRAAIYGKVSLMLPMITTLSEIQQVKIMLSELSAQLADLNIPHCSSMPLGVMLETPAAVLICDSIARECDFLSIGTNDLLHYLMAIDRNNRHVSYLHDPLHPAFTRSVKRITEAAHSHGIEVTVCGELAAQPIGLALLLGLGVDSLSASPGLVPALKHMIRKLDVSVCANMANTILGECDTVKSARIIIATFQSLIGSDALLPNSLIADLIDHE